MPIPAERAAELRRAPMPSWELTARQLCDFELLATGAFSPLTTFLGSRDYDAVVAAMRLADGALWPIPVVLDVPADVARQLERDPRLALRDAEGTMLGFVAVEEMWQPDREREAVEVYGTSDRTHPGVAYVLDRTNDFYISGSLEVLGLPERRDFRRLRFTPAELRDAFAARGWDDVIAFQTRNPMHRAHYEITLRAMRDTGAKLLIHPAVGTTKPGDVDHVTRVRCYDAVLRRYPRDSAMLALLPLSMRMGGPREALWHALIRRNHGCTRLIVGRDHAGPGGDFYEPFAAQELVAKHAAETGIAPVPFPPVVYAANRAVYVLKNEVRDTDEVLDLSGTELRRLLARGEEIPEWFTFPEVARELRRRHRPRGQQGITVFFTGLPASGKSTIAQHLIDLLGERGEERTATVLDGDLVRKNLSSELGFSREHRDLNIRRIGFVAAEITKAGGIAVCAPIAPFDAVRKDVRAMIEPHGRFLLVHVATPVEVCESRDPKGLYAKARAGLVANFTGVSDPYEVPEDADLTIDTTTVSASDAAGRVVAVLEAEGYLPGG